MTGAEYKKGRSRTLQLQNKSEDGFSRFFDFKKVSYGKYEITQIYDRPLQIENNRKAGNASVYLLYIELILLKYLSSKYTKEVTFSRKKLWMLLGMVNGNYGNVDRNRLLKINDVITPYEIDNFYLRANHRLDRILKTALKNLSDRKLIDSTEQTMICEVVGNKETYHIATPDERSKIIEIERMVLDTMNFETISQVVMKRKQKEFYQIVNDKLYDLYHWKYFYKAYSIVFNHKDIERFIPRIEMNLNSALQKMNAEIIRVLDTEAEKIYFSENKKYDEKIDMAEDEIEFYEAIRAWHPPFNYVVAQKILSDELININLRDNCGDDDKDIVKYSEEVDELFALDEK